MFFRYEFFKISSIKAGSVFKDLKSLCLRLPFWLTSLWLILSTAIVKNSTKRIDDEIFVLREDIRSLKKDFENTKLENDYLSSAEKLLEFQNLYFDSELVKKDIQEIGEINKDSNQIEVNQFSFVNDQ